MSLDSIAASDGGNFIDELKEKLADIDVSKYDSNNTKT